MPVSPSCHNTFCLSYSEEAVVTIPRTDNKKEETKAYPSKNKLKKEDFKGIHTYFILHKYITNIL